MIDSPEIKHTDADIGERVPDVGLAAVARAVARAYCQNHRSCEQAGS
jgi:hypothetical protein